MTKNKKDLSLLCLIFSQTVWGSSGDEEKVSCWWVEARCSYHVTLFGSESLWDWGGHKHSDKRGEKRRIKEEEGRREVGWFWGGGGDCYTKKSKKQGHLPHSPPKIHVWKQHNGHTCQGPSLCATLTTFWGFGCIAVIQLGEKTPLCS